MRPTLCLELADLRMTFLDDLERCWTRLSASIDEMRQARERKDRGNPPGKARDPLADQITWEQWVIHGKESKCTRLWMVTSDQDDGIEHQKRFLLNSLLTKNPKDACAAEPEIHCFNNLSDEIRHFRNNAGVKAEKFLTAEEAAQIKKETAALPPIGWLTDTDEPATEATLFRYNRMPALEAGGCAVRPGMSSITIFHIPPAPGTTEPTKSIRKKHLTALQT